MKSKVINRLKTLNLEPQEVDQIRERIEELRLYKYIGDLCGIQGKTVGMQLRTEIPLNWKVLHECRKVIKSLEEKQ